MLFLNFCLGVVFGCFFVGCGWLIEGVVWVLFWVVVCDWIVVGVVVVDCGGGVGVVVVGIEGCWVVCWDVECVDCGLKWNDW